MSENKPQPSAQVAVVVDIDPHMKALDERQRRFVAAYVRDSRNATKCAEVAGYAKGEGLKVTAHRLLRNPKIISAIKYEADRNLNSSAYIAATGLADIAADPEHRDRYRACADILDRTGFPRRTEHAVHVENELEAVSTTDLLRMLAEYRDRKIDLIEGEVLSGSGVTNA